MPSIGNLLSPYQIDRARRVLCANSHCANVDCDCHVCTANHTLIAYLRCDALLRHWRESRTYGTREAAEVARMMEQELRRALRVGSSHGIREE